MKTYKNLYPRICALENLERAFHQARRGKRRRRNVASFECNLELELIGLQDDRNNPRNRNNNRGFRCCCATPPPFRAGNSRAFKDGPPVPVGEDDAACSWSPLPGVTPDRTAKYRIALPGVVGLDARFEAPGGAFCNADWQSALLDVS